MLTHAVVQLKAALAGHYEIERELGRGGMATVYLGRDLRHDRLVALKVLDPELGAVLGADRFLAEIRVTANLQHPNLLPLFDSGEIEGALFYVMPYVDGESLRGRLEREKQLVIEDAVHIAAAVANALDYAHRHGVIHRDLKPENILLHEGQPLVADFGIALAVSNAGGHRITQTGISLGTPQYISPEQATGDRTLDARADIYSLGAVLYEMLTGEPPHTGNTAQAIIARVLTERPRPIHVTRDAVPSHVAAAAERALAKLPADRFATAQEFADALSARAVAVPVGVVTPGSFERTRVGRTQGWRVIVNRAIPWGLAVGAGFVAGYAVLARQARDEISEPVVRMVVPLSDSMRLSTFMGGPNIVLSPDGARFVYTAAALADQRLVVRPLDDLTPKALAGTEGAGIPTFSPDGKWIAFRSGHVIRTIAAVGGAPTTVLDLGREYSGLAGLSWDDRGDIVFAASAPNGVRNLWRVPATGGLPRLLVRPDTSRGRAASAGPMCSPEVVPRSSPFIR